ncbi:hypothetical protein KKB3_01696 [Dehalococcoides mccartyi]|nr:hypothetical protein KKB3_01696 [Dehalococcoides mccartyi]
MNNLEDVLVEHIGDCVFNSFGSTVDWVCATDCPRCAQDRLLEHLRILLRLELPLARIDTNPEGTYADGFVDGKVAQLEHDMETINKILGET